MRLSLLAIAIAAASASVFAEEAEKNIEETYIVGVRERLYQAGMLKDVIQKTEIISNVSIEQTNSANLTDALAEAPGVRVNNECSMCGVKRVMLNGLRGEHTTILVDGIPVYTMMSGFYGLDAATVDGIDRIEIARGAGASLIAPEAIGGTINLVTKEATENGGEINLTAGEDNYSKLAGVGTAVLNDGATRLTFSGQFDHRDIYDADNNGVGESPELENLSGTVFLSQDFSANDNLRVRLNKTESEIFGGPVDTDIGAVKSNFYAAPDESDPIFANGDVRNKYIGQPWATTEWIKSDRTEFYASWLHEFNTDFNMTLTGSVNEHTQESFYEGFIYDADNKMTFLDARFNFAIDSNHLLTFGIDSRDEELRSETNSESPKYVSDSFDYDTQGLYLQDTWNASEDLEVAVAVRYDQVKADFIDPEKSGTEIDKSLVSPRMDLRYTHSESWTSRLSAGRGYRAPLSFFESDHGILDGDLGFDIQIDELERSRSFNYALSYEGSRFSGTASVSQTAIENLATLSETEDGVPVLEQMEETAETWVVDFALNYDITEALGFAGTLEKIGYSDEFKQAFGVVPVEERMVLAFDYDKNGWDVYFSATWVGRRDLTKYGTPENPTFDVNGEHPKSTQAQAYWTADFRIAKELGEKWQVYLGATNMFDYTQVNDMETPLFYEIAQSEDQLGESEAQAGEFDVGHIYGPMRGREAYLGVKLSF